MAVTDNFSGPTIRASNRFPTKLAIHEHIVDDATGGTDTDALPSSALTERGALASNIGKKITIGDRSYVFCRSAANVAIGPGKVVACDYSVQGIGSNNIDNSCTAAGKGDRTVTVTEASLGSVTKDLLVDAYLVTESGAGLGYAYRIRSNTAAASNAVTFTLYDTIAVAVTTATDVSIMPNRYDNVIVSAGATAVADSPPVGVSQANITADGSGVQQFFWAQYAGPCAVLSDGAITAGFSVMISDGTDGSVEVFDIGAAPGANIGYTLDTTVTGEYGQMIINIP